MPCRLLFGVCGYHVFVAEQRKNISPFFAVIINIAKFQIVKEYTAVVNGFSASLDVTPISSDDKAMYES